MSEIIADGIDVVRVLDNLIAIGKECVRAINEQPGCPYIVIRGHFPSKGWPRGKCCGSDRAGRFYWYDARKVLAKIVSLGLMVVEWISKDRKTSDSG